jgi:hypothetical protein
VSGEESKVITHVNTCRLILLLERCILLIYTWEPTNAYITNKLSKNWCICWFSRIHVDLVTLLWVLAIFISF